MEGERGEPLTEQGEDLLAADAHEPDRPGLRSGSLKAWQPEPPRVFGNAAPDSKRKQRLPAPVLRVVFFSLLIAAFLIVAACIVFSAAVALAVVEGREPASGLRPLAGVAGLVALVIGAPALMRWKSRAADLTDFGVNHRFVPGPAVEQWRRFNERVYLSVGLIATSGGVVSLGVAFLDR